MPRPVDIAQKRVPGTFNLLEKNITIKKFALLPWPFNIARSRLGVGFFLMRPEKLNIHSRWCECPHKREDWCRRASLWTRATRRVSTKSSELFCSAFAIKLMHFLYAIRQFSFPLFSISDSSVIRLFSSFSGFNTSYKENYIRWYFSSSLISIRHFYDLQREHASESIQLKWKS